MSSINEDWRERYTVEQIEAIIKVWNVPPKECKGKCKPIYNMFFESCGGCDHDDFSSTPEFH